MLRAVSIEPVEASTSKQLLPRQLALAFRGALSFWTAGELPDDELGARARTTACSLLLAAAAERPPSDAAQ